MSSFKFMNEHHSSEIKELILDHQYHKTLEDIDYKLLFKRTNNWHETGYFMLLSSHKLDKLQLPKIVSRFGIEYLGFLKEPSQKGKYQYKYLMKYLTGGIK